MLVGFLFSCWRHSATLPQTVAPVIVLGLFDHCAGGSGVLEACSKKHDRMRARHFGFEESERIFASSGCLAFTLNVTVSLLVFKGPDDFNDDFCIQRLACFNSRYRKCVSLRSRMSHIVLGWFNSGYTIIVTRRRPLALWPSRQARAFAYLELVSGIHVYEESAALESSIFGVGVTRLADHLAQTLRAQVFPPMFPTGRLSWERSGG